MSGHVFIVRGDLTRLACDAWLIPSDENKIVERYWTAAGYGEADYQAAPALSTATRAVPLPKRPYDGTKVRFRPRPWLGNIGLNKSDVKWFVSGAVAFLQAASAAIEEEERLADPKEPLKPLFRRDRYLLALPVVGTGKGSGAEEAGAILEQLLPALHEFVRGTDRFDVALVCYDADIHAAAQAVREQHLKREPSYWIDQFGGGEPGRQLVERAKTLADQARLGNLALFLGAGVSVGAGLPTWEGLLKQLAGAVGKSADWEGLKGVRSALDQASIVQRWLPKGTSIGVEVEKLLKGYRHYAPAHALLAALPVREVVTTNYDQLFDRAWEHVHKDGTSILPHRPRSSAARWLLKMHGCLTDRERIVLTRESYIRYDEGLSALAGLVQAFLLTRHMLFVGFSLTDDNFHRLVDGVRRLRGSDEGVGEFGTALALGRGGVAEVLWKGDVQRVSMSESAEDADNFPVAQAARRLNVFLDYLVSLVRDSAHLLVGPRFDRGVLSDGEKQLRNALAEFVGKVKASDEIQKTAAWPQIKRLLLELGYKLDDRHGKPK